MPNTGVRNPGRNLLIALAITLISWAAVAWGFSQIEGDGVEPSWSGAMAGIGLLPAILGPFVVLNFWWGIQVFASIRRGESVMARWHIPAAHLTDFRVEDEKRSSHGLAYFNDWTPPRKVPPEGINVHFTRNGVLVHDTYFGLSNFGPYRFERVGILPGHPLSIEFLTTSLVVNRFSARQTRSVLRLPIPSAEDPEALKVLDHYRQVLAGKVSSNPDFYPNRVRVGLAAALVLLPIAGLGAALDQNGFVEVDVPSIITIFGGVFGLGALLLALIAWVLGRKAARG
jgi:hypothetical protein